MSQVREPPKEITIQNRAKSRSKDADARHYQGTNIRYAYLLLIYIVAGGVCLFILSPS